MPKSWGLAGAIAHFGAAGKNPRWSWSGRSADGTTVVITLWRDLIRRQDGRIVYDNFERAQEPNPSWIRRPGNRERLENLLWARDHCDGYFKVVVVVAKDTNAEPREIAECYPQDRLRMRLERIDEASGRFRAIQEALDGR